MDKSPMGWLRRLAKASDIRIACGGVDAEERAYCGESRARCAALRLLLELLAGKVHNSGGTSAIQVAKALDLWLGSLGRAQC
ncbi:hypothetical protein KVR01_003020 [Diaporthe batatas]|uniref:uncharacterized protein n=1 Tax=Diaporthe batatas TaxID=748121 RepID=UPI001D056204|nr:uncharacterized protein KVR01_003020 [Diaporthe batatas]KAG8167331.1 hypothetical protein KVR01_003020 [Diaporthe batatas]